MKHNVMLSVLVIAAFVLGGCAGKNKRIDPYTQIHCEGKSLAADCIVTFYEDDNTYISEQHHEICLAKPYIEIAAEEPTGSVGSKLSGSDFYNKKPMPSNIEPMIADSTYAKMILTLMTAGNIGWEEVNAISTKTVNIFGSDYKAAVIEPLVVDEKKTAMQGQKTFLSVHSVPWAEITLYANVQTKLIDRISIKNPKSGAELSAYGFNWHNVREINKQVPTKIDVYGSNVWDIDTPKTLQISYLNFSITKNPVLTKE